MMVFDRNMSSKNTRTGFIKQPNKYILLAVFFVITINLLAQVDSLKSDTTTNIPRIKINSKDSSSKYVPVYELASGNDTSTSSANQKIPARAALLSAILPGLGQAYNGNYWKIPIIYSVFAGLFFIGEETNNRYFKFKRAYKYFDDGYKEPGINDKLDVSKERLKYYKDYNKRNRDLYIILGVAAYLLNILDASVDAHLMNYDISDDLSMKVQPDINLYKAYQKNTGYSTFGIKFVLSLHR
jgi:hypothetical protein